MLNALKLLILISASLLAGFSTTVYAHDDATLDAMTAPHGGRLRMAGPYHFELILKSDKNLVQVYLTDHANQPLPAKGLKGQVAIIAQGQKINIDLKSDERINNLLSGSGKFAIIPNQTNISVTVDNNTARYKY